jgi:2,3,4,5-tetrahydropyridine-2-carboxylate N-succinyltransferase
VSSGLRERIGEASRCRPDPPDWARAAVEELLDALESGELRAAEPVADGSWRVEGWIKEGILLAFRLGGVRELALAPGIRFHDRELLPPREPDPARVRMVPGGSAVRRGAFLGRGVVMMPPAYVNVGAYVGDGTMIDSHALVGSCAQVGERVHVSAAVQIGGVLEPVGARPVIVEDEVLLGGQVGLYEGVRVRARAVLGAGLVLTGTSRVYDLVHEREWTGEAGAPLEVPEGAVVVPGTRPAAGAYAGERGLGLHAAVVVKYRDSRTDARSALEEALR